MTPVSCVGLRPTTTCAWRPAEPAPLIDTCMPWFRKRIQVRVDHTFVLCLNVSPCSIYSLRCQQYAEKQATRPSTDEEGGATSNRTRPSEEPNVACEILTLTGREIAPLGNPTPWVRGCGHQLPIHTRSHHHALAIQHHARPLISTTHLALTARSAARPHKGDKMGTNTSSPAAYVDTSTDLSGIARMGGAQPRSKPRSKAEHQTTATESSAASTAHIGTSELRRSVDTLPPYTAADTRPSSAS